MTTLDDLRGVLPDEAIDAWPHVAACSPDDGVLMGGTALAVHLRHRVSRDLDVFTSKPFEPHAIAAQLSRRGPFAITTQDAGTLNGLFDRTKVQFLWAAGQRVLEPGPTVAGLTVGSLSDLIATKLKVTADRGELRDYFDLMTVEQQTGRRMEEGLLLYMARFHVDATNASIDAIVRGFGYFDDVETDPHLTAEHGTDIFDRVADYWRRRQPEILASLDPR